MVPVLHAEGVAVVIPAFQEQERIESTVRAATKIPGVDVVVVVDDGSADDTAATAAKAGAYVVRQPHNGGKAAAMERGAAAVATLERAANLPGRPLLFLDADLADSAVAAAPLLAPVVTGVADLTIATLPEQPGGGRGFVVRLAHDGIQQATGWSATQPLSGQRALTREAFDAALPLGRGFGVEVAMTVDLLRQGFRVVEVPVDLRHRVTGRDWRSHLHRGRQFWHVWRALRTRGAGPRVPIPH